MKTLSEIFETGQQAATIQKYLKLSGLQDRTLESLEATDLVTFAEIVRHHLCQSSSKTILSTFSAALRRYGSPLDFSAVFRLRCVKPTKIFLSEAEIAKIAAVKPQNRAEDYAKTLFLICAKTGTRISDALQLTSLNIQDGVLSYVSQKTSTEAAVPVSPTTAKLILKLSLMKHKYTLAHYNNCIRSLADNAGIRQEVQVFSAGKKERGPKWQFVSSHTARRSFATNLYLRGCDIYDISKMMGHSSTAMTNGYISSPTRNLTEKTLAFFRD